MSIIDRSDLTSLNSWHEVVSALPSPAALIDRDGRVVSANQWLQRSPGDQLLRMEDLVAGLTLGIDSDTTWRVAQLRKDDLIYLATAEELTEPDESDPAQIATDHMLGRFFAPTETLYVVTDATGRAIEWNAACSTTLGMTDQELTGLDLWDLLLAEDADKRATIEAELRDDGRSKPGLRIRVADGGYAETQWVLLLDHERGRCYGVGRSAAEAAAPQREMQLRAYTDDLTGLATRSRTILKLDSHLQNNSQPAILFCDLDQFKVVNDSLGHAVGDRLLASLAERLSQSLDSPDITVGRLGGDEFAVVIADGGLPAAEAAAKRAFEAVSREFLVGDRSVRIGMSIGICVAETDRPNSAALMFERADMAVYKAKEDGRNRSFVFGPELQERVDRQFDLEAALRKGLDNNEFEPWFQPVISIQTGKIVGVEALLRWYRDEGEILSPETFLDVAIETGLIAPIGRQMIGSALTEFTTIAGSSISQDIFLTVNVSARELIDDGFTEWFVDRVASASIRPSQIVLEITESTAIEEHELSNQLSVFRAVGFRIALDDFGTGHSSLAHLRTLPIDIVKIDRSFVADLVDDPTTSALTRSIVDLCAALDLMVIFEGVETQEESLAVIRAGGQYAQGFLHAKPMPVSELQWQTVSAALARRLAARRQIDPTF